MATAAFNKKVELAISGHSSTEVKGMNDASISFGGDILDSTAFDNIVNGTRSKFYGLRDASVSLSGDFLPSDTTHQDIMKTWFGTDTDTATIKYYPTGSGTFFTFDVIIESVEINGGVDGKEEISISLQSTGSITTTFA